MEDRRRAIMEQQARIAREMAEREAEEKRLQAVRMEQEAAFREEQRRRAEVEAERVEQEKRRLAEIERQRALVRVMSPLPSRPLTWQPSCPCTPDPQRVIVRASRRDGLLAGWRAAWFGTADGRG